MDPHTIISSIKDALGLLGGIQATVKAINDANQASTRLEFKEQINDIREQLSDARESAMTLLEENQDLRQQLLLQEELSHQEDGNILWRILNGEKKGPYCSTCYGDLKKLISLSGRNDGAWTCPKCKNHFSTIKWYTERKSEHAILARASF